MKNEVILTLKKMLFMYLAMSKIMYWIVNIVHYAYNDFDGVGQLVLSRLVTQDLFYIVCVIFAFLLMKYVKNTVFFLVIFYILVIGLVAGNAWVYTRFFETEQSAMLMPFANLDSFIGFTIVFIAVAVIMSIKDYMKKVKYEAEAKEYESKDGMSDFSNALICNSCKVDLQDKLSLFGQFVGEWEFEKIVGKDTPDEQRIAGEWIFSWILDGTAIQDVFISPSRKEREKSALTGNEYGTTIRFYNLATDAWDMYYGILGATQVLEGRQVEDQIIIKCKSESSELMQQVFSNITPSSFFWQTQRSRDNGVTWNDVFELTACRK